MVSTASFTIWGYRHGIQVQVTKFGIGDPINLATVVGDAGSSIIAFSGVEREIEGAHSRRISAFSLKEVFILPARLALLNILCRIPLSISTAYGLTA